MTTCSGRPEGARASKLLDALPEGAPRLRFTTMEDLSRAIVDRSSKCCLDNLQNPFLIVTEVPSTVVSDFDEFYPDRGPRFMVDIRESLLVVETMVYGAHEFTAFMMSKMIFKSIERMHLEDEIKYVGAMTVNSTDGKFHKQANGSFALSNHLSWPTLTIEVGFSESANLLAIAAQGWLEALGSSTQSVLTVTIERQSPAITFQLWDNEVRTRRITRSYRPVGSRSQQAQVSYNHGRPRVTGGITIPFEKVFGREKRQSNERDFVFTKTQFLKIAMGVWQIQGFTT